MHVVFLGTASCFPTPTRGVSCAALQLDDGNVWLFDCGEGSQIQIQKSRLKHGKVSKIFITHLHGDHVFGLPGMLCTLGSGGSDERKPVDIYGPLGLRKYIATTLELARSPLSYKYNVHELVPNANQYPEDWEDWPVEHEREYKCPKENSATKIVFDAEKQCWPLLDEGLFTVNAAAITHRIPSFGFVITEKDQPGSLDVQKLAALGIKPGPIFGRIKRGEDVTLENGTVIKAIEVGGPVKRGRKVAILGDTCDTQELQPLLTDCDLLVHEATMEDSLREKCILFGHSTPSMAAETALKVGAKKLCLTHVSPRYKPFQTTSTTDDVGDVDASSTSDAANATAAANKKSKLEGGKSSSESAKILLDEAKAFLEEKQAATGLTVEIAEDFYEIKV